MFEEEFDLFGAAVQAAEVEGTQTLLVESVEVCSHRTQQLYDLTLLLTHRLLTPERFVRTLLW